jgi:integrase
LTGSGHLPKNYPVRKCNTKAWRSALVRVGIDDFRWHDLRHTWASWHVQAGTPLHVLQELGGWSDVRMVLRYAHLAPEHLAADAERLCRLPPTPKPAPATFSATHGGQKKKAASSTTANRLYLVT